MHMLSDQFMFSLMLEGGQLRYKMLFLEFLPSLHTETNTRTHSLSAITSSIKRLNTFLVSCFLLHSNPNLPCFHSPAAHEKRCFTCCQWSGCNSMSHHDDTTALSLWDAGHVTSIGWGSLGVSLVTFIMMYFI